MARPSKFWIDVVAGGGLFVALLLVFVVDYFASPARRALAAGELDAVVIDSAPRQGSPKALKLAVTPSDRMNNVAKDPYDDMGKLLNHLGDGYRYDVLQPHDIAVKPGILTPYDVLFLTCGSGGEEMKDALRAFVGNGGTLYASDLRYDVVAKAFPEAVGAGKGASGCRQEVVADVIDPGLQDALGAKKIRLKFDLTQWRVASFGGPRVTPLVRGPYRKERFPNDPLGIPQLGTFLVRFPFGKGTVIFTSFHNEKQNTDMETKLLEYLVFQLVNAGIDSEVTHRNEQEGFAPAKSTLLSTPTDQSVTKTYFHPKPGPLRFSLAFRDAGAKLHLDLRSPDGKSRQWQGNSTVIIDVPDAKPGEWTCVITAKELPYPNFPFSVTFGAKK